MTPDAAKTAAGRVLQDIAADPESQRATAAGAGASKGAAASNTASALFLAAGAAAAVWVL